MGKVGRPSQSTEEREHLWEFRKRYAGNIVEKFNEVLRVKHYSSKDISKIFLERYHIKQTKAAVDKMLQDPMSRPLLDVILLC